MKIVTINQLPETNSLDGKYGICSDSNGNVNKYNLDIINNISTLENTINNLNNTITDIEDELQAQYNYSPVEYVYVESLILRSDGIIKQSDATAYGVIYTPVSKGQRLHFYASEGKRFARYANVIFTEEIPSVGVTGTVLSTNETDGNAMVDFNYTAEKMAMFVSWCGQSQTIILRLQAV